MSECIHTDRLLLRRFCDADAACVTDLIGVHSVARWLTHVPHPYAQADALSFFARHAEDDMTLAITLSGEVIGGCGIDKELGYWLGVPFWGQGYATEAAGALVDRYFNRSETPLRSGYIAGNSASAKVLSKLGFERTSLEETESLALKTRVSLQKMSLSKDAWRACA